MKKIISLLLTIAMVLTLVPAVVFADTDPVYVAQIGDTGYETLTAALKAVQNNETVKVLKDCDFTETDQVVINNKGNVTLDLNGKKVTVQGNYIIVRKTNLTVTGNGTIDYHDIPDDSPDKYQGYIFVVDDNGTLTFKNGTFSAYGTIAQAGSNNGKGTVKVYSGEYTCEYGTYDGRSWMFNKKDKTGSVIEIYGGTFHNFNPASGKTENPDETFIANGYKVVEDENSTCHVTAENPVAEIGSATYATLADAVAAVPDSTKTTIKMISNEVLSAGVTLPATKKIILDLNGKVISSTKNEAAGSALITNSGDLTITDESDSGDGKLTTEAIQPDLTPTPGYANNTITNHGTLTVQGGSIINTSSKGAACYAIDNQNYGGGNAATLEITGGTVSSTGTYAIRMWLNTNKMNTVSITGGTIKSLWVQEDYAACIGSLTIKNATFTGGVKVGYSGTAEHFVLDIQNSTFGGLVQYELDATKTENKLTFKGNACAPFYMNKASKVLTDGTYTFEGNIKYGWVLENTEGSIDTQYPESKGWFIDQSTKTVESDGTWYTAYMTPAKVLVDFDAFIVDGYIKAPVEGKANTYIITVAPTKVEVKEKAYEVVTEGEKADIISEKISSNKKAEIASDAKQNVVDDIINNASETSDSNIQQVIKDGQVEAKKADQTPEEIPLSESSKTRIDVELESLQINVDAKAEVGSATDISQCTITTKTATYDVKPIVTVTQTDGSTGETTVETYVITNKWLKDNNKTLTFTLPIPDTMTGDSVLVKHIKENKDEETFNTRVQIKDSKRFITISATEFSTYELIQQTEEGAVAKIVSGGKTYFYSSLANAISDAQNNDTVVLLNDSETGQITVDREVTFTINNGEFTNAATIVAGEGYKLFVEGDKYTVKALHNVIVEVQGSHGKASSDLTEAAEGETVTLTAIPDNGYSFKEWVDVRGNAGTFDKTSAITTIEMPAKEIKVKAVFEKSAPAINLQDDGHGSAVAKVNGKVVESAVNGSTVTLYAIPDNGYVFDKWVIVSGLEDGAITDNSFTMPEGSVTIKATFKPSPYTITVEDDGHGIATYKMGEDNNVILIATPNEGYAFKEWRIVSGLTGETLTGNFFEMPNNNVKVKAIFERVYKINVQVQGLGHAFAKVGSEIVTEAAANSEVVLTANAYLGNQFEGWTIVSGLTEGALTEGKFRMPGNNVTIKATFTTKEVDPIIPTDPEITKKDLLKAAVGGAVVGGVVVGATAIIGSIVNDRIEARAEEAAAAAATKAVCPRDLTCPLAQFTDLETTKWYHDGIHYCLENGLINGFPGNVFKPNGNITRAQLLTIMWRLADKPVVNYALTASDVVNDEFNSWYLEAVRWAKAEGISSGVSEDFFGPNQDLTREEFASILYNYAKYKGVDTANVIANVDALKFEDFGLVSERDAAGMYYCIGAGVIGGDDKGKINPKSTATRAEAAAMLQRFCEGIEK